MKKLKLIGPYKDYGRPDMWDDNSNIICYADIGIRQVSEYNDKQVALLIEPRSIQENIYDLIERNYMYFKYVFTHDDKLLNTLPNAKPIIWGGVWCRSDEKKTKLISMTSSDKEACELHKVRKRIAQRFKNDIDVYGTIDGGKYTDPIDTLKEYKYNVVIENYINDLWFTEKILNCFATKTIPIYLGSKAIGNYFNKNSIIICENEESVAEAIKNILEHENEYDKFYNDNIDAINENYELSKNYENFETMFYNTYEKELNELFK